MGTLVVLDKEKDIKGMMLTDKNGELISLKDFTIPPNCVALFVDHDVWVAQSK